MEDKTREITFTYRYDIEGYTVLLRFQDFVFSIVLFVIQHVRQDKKFEGVSPESVFTVPPRPPSKAPRLPPPPVTILHIFDNMPYEMYWLIISLHRISVRYEWGGGGEGVPFSMRRLQRALQYVS